MSRARFEEWCEKNNICTHKRFINPERNEYMAITTEQMWISWQAAERAVVRRCVELCEAKVPALLMGIPVCQPEIVQRTLVTEIRSAYPEHFEG